MNRWQAVSDSGVALSFKRCKGGYFSSDEEYALRLQGKMSQATFSGKNLFDISKVAPLVPDMSNNLSNDGASLYVTPTSGSSGISSVKLSELAPLLKVGEAYTLSAASTGTKKSIVLSVSQTSWQFGSTRTITQNDLDSVVIWYANGDANPSFTAVISNIQIEYGTEATVYEPYVGGMISPSPDYPQQIKPVELGTKIKVYSENLLDGDGFANDAVSYSPAATKNSLSKTLSFPAGALGKYKINTGLFEESTQYTFIFRGYNTGCVNGFYYSNLLIRYTDGTSQYIQPFVTEAERKITSITVSAQGKTVAYLECINQGYSTVLWYEECGIFKGKTAEENFVPYNGSEAVVPVDLFPNDIWYPGSGKLKRNTAVYILTGDEAWTQFQGKPVYSLLVSDADFYGGIRCTHFNNVNYVQNRDDVTYGCFHNPASKYIYFRSAPHTTIEQWTDFLKEKFNSGYPIRIAYPLEHPYTDQIMPQPIAATAGDLNVTQISSGTQGTLYGTVLVLNDQISERKEAS